MLGKEAGRGGGRGGRACGKRFICERQGAGPAEQRSRGGTSGHYMPFAANGRYRCMQLHVKALLAGTLWPGEGRGASGRATGCQPEVPQYAHTCNGKGHLQQTTCNAAAVSVAPSGGRTMPGHASAAPAGPPANRHTLPAVGGCMGLDPTPALAPLPLNTGCPLRAPPRAPARHASAYHMPPPLAPAPCRPAAPPPPPPAPRAPHRLAVPPTHLHTPHLPLHAFAPNTSCLAPCPLLPRLVRHHTPCPQAACATAPRPCASAPSCWVRATWRCAVPGPRGTPRLRRTRQVAAAAAGG